MVMVKQPCLSGWASGSIFKTITFRALFNQRFCIHRFRHTQRTRSPDQVWAQERFAKRISMIQDYAQTNEYRSTRFGMSWIGLGIFGAHQLVELTLLEIPHLEE